MAKSLTIKQRRFVRGFVGTANGTEAVIDAYHCSNRITAASIASENLRKPQIREEIARLLQEENIDLSLVLQSVKKNLTGGAGRHAKASDSNKAAEILLRVAGAFDKPSGPGVQYNLYADMRDVPRKEILQKRNELHGYFNNILDGETVA